MFSCYKCFTDEQTLLEHIPKHKESKHLKVHICPFCGKSYTQATYLAKHMTKHSDRKPSKNAIDDHLWTSRESAALCASQNVTDSCGETTPTGALSFSNWFRYLILMPRSNRHLFVLDSFQQAHNHMMQSQNCAYTSGIASSMAAASMSAAAADPSAFTRLAGLTPLSGRLAAAATTRNPYSFAYDNFKPNAHTAAGLSHHRLVGHFQIYSYSSSTSCSSSHNTNGIDSTVNGYDLLCKVI